MLADTTWLTFSRVLPQQTGKSFLLWTLLCTHALSSYSPTFPPPQGLTCFTALSQFPVFKSTVTLLLYFFPFLMISHKFSPFNNQNPFLAQCGASPAVLLRLVLLSDWETDGNREEKIYLNKFKTPRREDFYISYIVSKGQRLENLPRGFISHHREADRHTAVAWTDSLKMCEWIKSDKYTLCHRFMHSRGNYSENLN